MADIGGTVRFDDIDLDGLSVPSDLPPLIPQIDASNVAALDADLGWGAYAVGLRRVLSPATFELLPAWRDRTAKEVLGLGADQRAVLVCYGEDPLVEALWTRRHSLTLALADAGWDLVLAPNFSCFGNQPRATMVINFRRNLLIAQEWCEAGIAAVPNLYSFRLEDLERYAGWLDRARPAAVAVNLQTQRDDNTFFEAVWPALAYVAGVLPPGCRFIATGSSRAARIAALVELFGDRLHLVTQNPVQYARHGAVMTPAGRTEPHAQVGDAFAANVRYYASLLAGSRH